METRNVEIIIKNDTNGGSLPPQPQQPDNAKTETDKNIASIIVNKGYDYLKALALNEVQYEMNKYFTMQDDYIGQRNVSVSLNIINKAKSFGTAVYAGVLINPVVGITVAIAQIAMLGVEVYQNYDRQNVQLKQMDAQLQYTRQRVGYSLTSGSVGENK